MPYFDGSSSSDFAKYDKNLLASITSYITIWFWVLFLETFYSELLSHEVIRPLTNTSTLNYLGFGIWKRHNGQEGGIFSLVKEILFLQKVLLFYFELQWWPLKILRQYSWDDSFCVSTTTESTKTNNIPLKSPIKLPPEMQKKILNFSKFVGF